MLCCWEIWPEGPALSPFFHTFFLILSCCAVELCSHDLLRWSTAFSLLHNIINTKYSRTAVSLVAAGLFTKVNLFYGSFD